MEDATKLDGFQISTLGQLFHYILQHLDIGDMPQVKVQIHEPLESVAPHFLHDQFPLIVGIGFLLVFIVILLLKIFGKQ